MNYIEIMGGLGNQFFQYTFSKYLEKITGNKSVLYMNFFDYIKNSPSLTKRENMLDKIKGNFSSVNGSIECRKIIEESYGYKASSEDDLIFYRGYWQNKSYFDEVKDIVINDLQFSDKYISSAVRKLCNNLSNPYSVSMHFRRTDFLNAENKAIFNTISYSYYSEALKKIEKLIGHKPIIYLFSDDSDYIKDINFEGYETYPISQENDYEDFYLMSHTKHHIIANSTFSWWSAILGETDGITIAPQKWYKSEFTPNIFFDDWILL